MLVVMVGTQREPREAVARARAGGSAHAAIRHSPITGRERRTVLPLADTSLTSLSSIALGIGVTA